MKTERIVRADSKGRILLGADYAGSFLGIQSEGEGLFLRKMQVIPLKNEKKKDIRNIVQFSGIWEDMSEEKFESFLTEVSERRKISSKRKKL
ncbi:MAG TPA: hypothetical protein PK453_02210 [Leptospiraceae bacterium]|nr:hypothetical protein [Leptospiraceae bacterium]HMY65808.1 hypothetical protein [Leptospiraceae bacterium]HNF12455.1 hypothetical protein [Leptospiraceae bacterium]HNF23988.1 hypothetical protein [Leptospiraceae bacterium]HNH09662.1 hypothetical protein [Leptospiraceae bacterium]